MEIIKETAPEQMDSVESASKENAEAAPKSSNSKAKAMKQNVEVKGPDVNSEQVEAVKAILNDQRYHAAAVPGMDNNVVINLTAAIRDGVGIRKLSVNRVHGKDQDKTGASIFIYGAQAPVVLVPKSVADKAGMKYERFKTDPNKDKPDEDAVLVCLDGHGRLEYALSQPIDKWPVLIAVLASKDKDGELHPERAFIETNVNAKTWVSQDYVIMRTCNPKCHEGWELIKKLTDKGYSFTVAAIFVTGKEGTVNKKTVINANTDEKELFKNMQYCEEIFNAAEKAFGQDLRSALRTKAVPNKIFGYWEDLKNSNLNAVQAKDKIIQFLDSLSVGEVNDINNAKRNDNMERDTVRKNKLDALFDKFKKANNL